MDKTKEIFKIAKKLMETEEKAKKLGIIPSYRARFQISKPETFIRLASANGITPTLEINTWSDGPYWYKVNIEGVEFLHISDGSIYPTDEVEAENESTR